MENHIILITGGSGFLGQHLVKEIQERDDSVKEIRILDLKPFVKSLDFNEKIPIRQFTQDLNKINDLTREAFKDVTCVFHCAARVSYEFPPNKELLYSNNIEGTKNVIQLCLEQQVKILVYTGTAEVCIKPYFRNSFFSLVVNQTEAKALPPSDTSQLVFGVYAESKLQAENLIIKADKTKFISGLGYLRTIVLRPTLMYGEGDKNLIPPIIQAGNYFNRTLYRVAGYGGRHQVVYAGNVAWAHICAKNTLLAEPEKIAGYPIFITDDSIVDDLLCFCKRVTKPCGSLNPIYKISSWYIPAVITFFLAILYEMIYKMIYPILKPKKMIISPKAAVIFLGSIIFFNRIRASTYLDYSPIYQSHTSYLLASKYYSNFIYKKKKS